MIGARPLRDLTAGDVRSALGQLVTRYSTRSLQITRNSLERAIRHAEANDLVGRNVAALVKAPRGALLPGLWHAGRPGRRSSLTCGFADLYERICAPILDREVGSCPARAEDEDHLDSTAAQIARTSRPLGGNCRPDRTGRPGRTPSGGLAQIHREDDGALS
jgi:hypothetical protein